MHKKGRVGLGWSHRPLNGLRELWASCGKVGTTMNVVELGAALRARRRSLNLTQNETADLADISTRVLSDLENGRETVRLDILTAVAAALGMSLTLAVTR